MMQVTDTPTTSRVETPNRIPVITCSKKSWFPVAIGKLVIGTRFELATGELVIEIGFPLSTGELFKGVALPSDSEVVVDELCVKL